MIENRHRLVFALVTLSFLFSHSLMSVNADQSGTPRRERVKLRATSINSIRIDPQDSPDSYIQSAMDQYHIPGVAACIVKSGTIAWTGVYGYRDWEQKLPAEENTLFMIASVSKTLTATAMMKLWEDDYFELDDNINDYLPFEVKNPSNPTTPITFRMLLTHTSSIKDNDNLMPYYYGEDSPIALVDYLRDYLWVNGADYSASRNFSSSRPGTRFDYSNIAIALVGYLVETISHQDFAEYCRLHIFQPLGMNATSWFLAGLDTTMIARPYHYRNGTYRSSGHFGYSDYPSGQIRTPIRELGAFLAAYMNGGIYNGARILQQATVDTILSLQIPQIDDTQGLVWYYDRFDDQYLWGHNGGDDGVETVMEFNPTTSTGVIVFLNSDSDGVEEIMNELFQYAETITVTNNAPTAAINQVSADTLELGAALTVSAVASDAEGDSVSMRIDWGDGSVSDYGTKKASGATFAWQHSYGLAGSFAIKARAKDSHDAEGDWSAVIYVVVSEPQPVNPPPSARIEGNPPDSILAGEQVTVSAVASDAEGDSVSMRIDWGDGSVTVYGAMKPSGETFTWQHAFNYVGDFNVKVKARDSHLEQGDWSDSVRVRVMNASALTDRQELESGRPA